MRTSKASWHAVLFRRAYIDDRGWLRIFDDYIIKRAMQRAGMMGLMSGSVSGITWVKNRHHSRMIILDENLYQRVVRHERRADAHSHKIHRCLYKFIPYVQATALRLHKAQLKRRMDAGQIALCPYFWSVILALLGYVLLQRTFRVLGQAFKVTARISRSWSQATERHSNRIGLAAACLLIGCVVVGALLFIAGMGFGLEYEEIIGFKDPTTIGSLCILASIATASCAIVGWAVSGFIRLLELIVDCEALKPWHQRHREARSRREEKESQRYRALCNERARLASQKPEVVPIFPRLRHWLCIRQERLVKVIEANETANLFFSYAKAVKNRVCPLIEFNGERTH